MKKIFDRDFIFMGFIMLNCLQSCFKLPNHEAQIQIYNNPDLHKVKTISGRLVAQHELLTNQSTVIDNSSDNYMTITHRPGELEFWQNIKSNIISEENPPRIYADWTASGRLYKPIEDRIVREVGPFMANTHTEDSYTGSRMTSLFNQAQEKIKHHVNAGTNDVLLTEGTGMTGALAKFIRLLGLWSHESHRNLVRGNMIQKYKPIVFITHREHHSNEINWRESLAEVKRIPSVEGKDEIDVAWLKKELLQDTGKRPKYASVTACSNVTGIQTPYQQIANIMHDSNGFCFVDFAASAPYVEMNMHKSESEWLDAIFFSPHKFLGGPGSSGVLIFNKKLYKNQIPDQPGGGTVLWTTPWGDHRFVKNIHDRESGGTPGIIQAIRTSLAIQLKEEMGIDRMTKRESELNQLLFKRLKLIPNIKILSPGQEDRLSIFSITFNNMDYKNATSLLSHRYHVEARGGCSCAGPYGHQLLGIDEKTSHSITDKLDAGIETDKPGWVRISLHPSMSDQDVNAIANAINEISNKPTNTNTDFPDISTSYKTDLWRPLLPQSQNSGLIVVPQETSV